jgi:hypothetical protein
MTDIGEEKVVRTVCGIEDGTDCGVLAHLKNGVLVKVEPDHGTYALRACRTMWRGAIRR